MLYQKYHSFYINRNIQNRRASFTHAELINIGLLVETQYENIVYDKLVDIILTEDDHCGFKNISADNFTEIKRLKIEEFIFEFSTENSAQLSDKWNLIKEEINNRLREEF